MAVRRVVTGHDGEGRSVVVTDAPVEPITTTLIPGFAAHEIWKADDTATVPATGEQPGHTTYYPPVNGVRFQVITIPPDPTSFPEGVDVEAAIAEMERLAPGSLAHNDPDNPGMHTTDSVDYVYVASGTVWLEVDNGQEIELHAGDTVVQQGTRHAWHNHSSQPCVIAGILVGAHRTH